MKLEDLSPEVQEKAEACETAEELAELAESEGIELSEDDLDAIAGGVSRKRILRPRRKLFKKPQKPQPQPQTQPQPEPQPQTYPDSVLPTVDPFADAVDDE